MMISSLSIKGLRGFATYETLTLAKPEAGRPASGLTILVGPNNGGKSTVVEAFRAITAGGTPSFTEGKRNVAAGDCVELHVKLADGSHHSLTTTTSGGSETRREPVPGVTPSILVLPSRRYFNVYFGKGLYSRDQFSRAEFPAVRSHPITEFAYRLFEMHGDDQKRAKFNDVLARVVRPRPDWTIDQQDSGQYYLKVKSGDAFHNSDGMGEGIVSLFFIVNALYDSTPDDVNEHASATGATATTGSEASSASSASSAEATGAAAQPKRYYGVAELDPVKASLQFAKIQSELIGLFTANAATRVRIKVDIEAENPEGFDETTVRAGKENGKTLGLDSSSFE
jgi:hypothetical protein